MVLQCGPPSSTARPDRFTVDSQCCYLQLNVVVQLASDFLSLPLSFSYWCEQTLKLKQGFVNEVEAAEEAAEISM